MTGDGKPPGNALRRIAPKGYAVRMMEPGDAPALFDLARRSDREDAASDGVLADFHSFTRYLLSHEVFVAIDARTQRPSGFAAAVAETDLYWLSRIVIDPDHSDPGPDAFLLKSVSERARWFFYRAIGTAISDRSLPGAAFFEKRGFVAVTDADLPALLDARRSDDLPDSQSQVYGVMLKWL